MLELNGRPRGRRSPPHRGFIFNLYHAVNLVTFTPFMLDKKVATVDLIPMDSMSALLATSGSGETFGE